MPYDLRRYRAWRLGSYACLGSFLGPLATSTIAYNR
jgi:hypothetical protein